MATLTSTQKGDEAQLAVPRKHPRYPFDSTWQHDIARCELGRSPILAAACPCGGTLFGKQRGKDFAFFASLPASDPHSFQAGRR